MAEVERGDEGEERDTMNRQWNCAVIDCEKETRARGMCAKHYNRARLDGSLTVIYPWGRDEVTDFWRRVVKTETCWLWDGTVGRGGYGVFKFRSQITRAHRWAYEHVIGAIPDGLVLDHLCRVLTCVRPNHLEPVTNGENVLRGISFSAVNKRKTHCHHGHPYDESSRKLERGQPRRECKACNALRPTTVAARAARSRHAAQ